MTLKLNAASGGSVALDAPTQTTSSADLTFKLPVADGSADQVLKTDGSGNLAFTALALGKLGQIVTQIYEPGGNSISTTGSTNYVDTNMQLAITPSNTNSKILIFGIANGHRSSQTDANSIINIKRAVSGGSTSNLAGQTYGVAHTYNVHSTTTPIFFVDGTTGTAERTYTVIHRTDVSNRESHIFRANTSNMFMLAEILP
tara:strand:- start:311 stop:913 length:603 start_codon:yes stop_codon:yes gene_type:complete